nr:dynactin subunit 3 isoform X2 [Caretta caretta]
MAAGGALQDRVEALERRVFGAGAARDWADPSAPAPRPAADGLVKVQVALGNITSKRERIKILYKKIEDLIKYLDPRYIDRMAVPDAMKLQFILAAAPDHAAKLQRLAQIHMQQQAVRVYYKQRVKDNATSDVSTSTRRHQDHV